MTKPTKKKARSAESELKDIVRQIVLAQGNVFIKELLRSNRIPIGTNKADFAENLNAAIDDGKLSRPMIEEWLSQVEGWGSQHVYLHRPPKLKQAQLKAAIERSKHADALKSTISHTYLDTLTLTSIKLVQDHLSVTWHRSRTAWDRTQSKDYQDTEGLDKYEYRAYRERSERSVVRFEWRLTDPYCALLIQLPNEGDEHKDAVKQVWGDLNDAGITSAPLTKINLAPAFKSFSRNKKATVRSTRFLAEGGHVDLVSTLAEGGGIDQVEAVRDVRQGVDDESFTSADGFFIFSTDQYKDLSRTIKLEGYGSDSRIRIWVQCKREDVYLILGIVWTNNAL